MIILRVQCFWLEPTDIAAIYLRRYRINSDQVCRQTGFYHDAKIRIEDRPIQWSESNGNQYIASLDEELFIHDSRWPSICICGNYAFTEADARQVFQDRIYKRVDTGNLIPLRNMSVGAMWDAEWNRPFGVGPDGRSLMVKLPNGFDWHIDGRCNNCTIPDDPFQERHHCWIRTGTPPKITVGKTGGVSCGAGGGSIQAGNYHGFLRNGEFTNA